MFLLFMADTAVRDIYREVEGRTFDRFRTIHHRALVFVVSKVLFAVAILCIGGTIIFVGGAAAFQITWHHPMELALLLFAYRFIAMLRP